VIVIIVRRFSVFFPRPSDSHHIAGDGDLEVVRGYTSNERANDDGVPSLIHIYRQFAIFGLGFFLLSVPLRFVLTRFSNHTVIFAECVRIVEDVVVFISGY